MESSTSTRRYPEELVLLGGAHGVSGRQAQRARRLAAGRSAILARLLVVCDVLSGCVASSLVLLAVGASAGGLVFIAATGCLWPLAGFCFGVYRGDELGTWASGVGGLSRTFVSLLAISWPLLALAALLGLPTPALVGLATVAATGGFSGVGRAAVRHRLHRNPGLRQRALILGSGHVAAEIARKLRGNRQFGVTLAGLVDDQVHEAGDQDLERLGGFADLEQVIDEYQIDRVIIAFSRASIEETLAAIRVCRNAGVPIDIVPRLFEVLDGVSALNQVGGLPLLSLGSPRLTPVSLAAKRLLDVAVSAIGIALLSPLLIATAIVIKLESPGPVFFRQPRAGRNRARFHMIKFRSMYRGAEERKREFERLNDVSDGVMFKIHRDPRVTRVGRVSRRFSIDELPQLFNVLKGDMSLVGPRPLVFPETAALEDGWQVRRLELRPGMTGPWQIYGRSQNQFQEMVRFDYQYVAGWSLARDIEILLETVPAVFSGRGAY